MGDPALSFEKHETLALAFCIVAVGVAVKWSFLGDRPRRFLPAQRVRLIVIYISGSTVMFDAVFYHFLRRELGALVFVPIAAFTMWMGYAMVTLVVRLRHVVAGRGDNGFGIHFGLAMVAFAVLTVGSLAFAIFRS